ncbi:hypothetical protein, partial [Corallococcus exiguus]
GNQVNVDLNSSSWRTEDGDLAIQLGYATTVYSSQGLTVGHTFIKDGWNLARDAAGVALSRHREASSIYASRQEHHERSMRRVAADEWRREAEFGDDEVLASLAKSWSRKNDKASTLDHLWQDSHGGLVDRGVILAEQKERAKASKSQNIQLKDRPLPEVEGASN